MMIITLLCSRLTQTKHQLRNAVDIGLHFFNQLIDIPVRMGLVDSKVQKRLQASPARKYAYCALLIVYTIDLGEENVEDQKFGISQ